MTKEYPPLLYGRPEDQILQLRAFLVRLVQYLDEKFTEATRTKDEDTTAFRAWQETVDGMIGTLRTDASALPAIDFGTAASSGAVTFTKAFAATPVIFATAGTISNASDTGFTLSAAASWIAIGDADRR